MTSLNGSKTPLILSHSLGHPHTLLVLMPTFPNPKKQTAPQVSTERIPFVVKIQASHPASINSII